MNGASTACHGVSRRRVLTGTALALGAAAAGMAIAQAPAQQKLTQADASYQGTPKDGQHCGACFNFQQPNGCRFVQGDINPSGWCQLFAPKT
jgi:hypothetical protein